jgi:putative ABC transport system substrate-binding protein
VLAALGGVVAWPQLARAQQRRLPTMGYLYKGSNVAGRPAMTAFRAGLAETGYVEGRNVAIVIREANNDRTLLPQLARELADFPVDVIVAPGSRDAILAASAATATIPIVFSNAGDWTKSPIVASLHRPGGNVTGISDFGYALSAKRIEFLKLLVPGASVIAALTQADSPQAERDLDSARESIRSLGAEVFVGRADTAEEIDAAFATFTHRRADGLCVAPGMLFVGRSAQIIGLAARHRLPAVYPFIQYARSGGLISYGSDLNERNRQTGIYAGLILNGAKPADLPVRRLENFELAINMTTAKALGLTVPASFLALADKVIE